jgi:hypothetical protein
MKYSNFLPYASYFILLRISAATQKKEAKYKFFILPTSYFLLLPNYIKIQLQSL